MKPIPDFKEGLDYYIDSLGRYVFTAHYLTKRGYCCKNGCMHCPYGFRKPTPYQGNPPDSGKGAIIPESEGED